MAVESSFQEKTKSKIKEPKRYKVIMYNDDFTPMDFVVEILVNIFHKNEAEAVELMLKVHKSDHAVVGEYSYDIAKTKVDESTAVARENGYPFRVNMMEA